MVSYRGYNIYILGINMSTLHSKKYSPVSNTDNYLLNKLGKPTCSEAFSESVSSLFTTLDHNSVRLDSNIQELQRIAGQQDVLQQIRNSVSPDIRTGDLVPSLTKRVIIVLKYLFKGE